MQPRQDTNTKQMEILSKGIEIIKNNNNQSKITTLWYVMGGYFISVVFFPRLIARVLVMRKEQSETQGPSTEAPNQNC